MTKVIYKLRPSIAIVEMEKKVEFFLSNIRKTIVIEFEEDIKGILFKFDGKKSVTEIMEDLNLNTEDVRVEFLNLVEYLNTNHILLKRDSEYIKEQKTFPRIFGFLEDYSLSIKEINNKFLEFQKKQVMVVGLGSVGTWVVHNLIMSGIKKIIIVDYDDIELSNLHRQVGFFTEDVGKKKIDIIEKRLKEIQPDTEVIKINDIVDDKFFNRYEFKNIDLIVNCADYPTVDATSKIIGEYCMRNKIPHIIGGGYNLHLTLIGQVIIPGETACISCFEKSLIELNEIDMKNIKKMNTITRKIGSFPPLTALSASITSNECIKVLFKLNNLTMTNNRSEFLLESMNFQNINFNRRIDCEWCGENGKFYKL